MPVTLPAQRQLTSCPTADHPAALAPAAAPAAGGGSGVRASVPPVSLSETILGDVSVACIGFAF